MSSRWKVSSLVLCAALFGAIMLIGADLAEAQATAVVTSVTGKVQVMPKGETAWRPLQLGMRVGEGADVAAAAGGRAELRLPDGSALTVAENTRFVVTKLDYDQQNRMRSSFFHLAAGKLRAFVNKAAASLVSARQANFAITTPTAVAAVRGSTLLSQFAPEIQVARFFCVDCTMQVRYRDTTYTAGPSQLLQLIPTVPPAQIRPVPAATAPADIKALINEIQSPANPATPGTGAVLGAPALQVISPTDVQNVISGFPAPPAPPAPPSAIGPPPPPPTTYVTNPSNPEALPPPPSQ
jgi:hypothetical protein